eukprot:4080299-Pyramimonas_sp.AAC.1
MPVFVRPFEGSSHLGGVQAAGAPPRGVYIAGSRVGHGLQQVHPGPRVHARARRPPFRHEAEVRSDGH